MYAGNTFPNGDHPDKFDFVGCQWTLLLGPG
jgi:hypothetical protein